MAQISLDQLTDEAATADGPSFTPPSTPKLGGVDPLGLRQINFDLMDQVLPGLNNVARHIRPFVVVTWAWRRAHQLAKKQSLDRIEVYTLRDFVDRIEVIYAWSQFLRNPDADLPGRQVLGPLLRSERWSFGGAAWRKRRDERRYSTAFTAPITYGPELKSLGWVEPHHEYSEILIPTPASVPALDAFELLIPDRLDHPAFCEFGSVEVTGKEALAWAGAWTLDDATLWPKCFWEQERPWQGERVDTSCSRLSHMPQRPTCQLSDLPCAALRQISSRRLAWRVPARRGGAFRFDSFSVWLSKPFFTG